MTSALGARRTPSGDGRPRPQWVGPRGSGWRPLTAGKSLIAAAQQCGPEVTEPPGRGREQHREPTPVSPSEGRDKRHGELAGGPEKPCWRGRFGPFLAPISPRAKPLPLAAARTRRPPRLPADN